MTVLWIIEFRGDIEEDRDALLARKPTEAQESGLYNSVKVYGVLNPIYIEPKDENTDNGYPEGFIADGYHRFTSAFNINPNMLVPVKDKDWDS